MTNRAYRWVIAAAAFVGCTDQPVPIEFEPFSAPGIAVTFEKPKGGEFASHEASRGTWSYIEFSWTDFDLFVSRWPRYASKAFGPVDAKSEPEAFIASNRALTKPLTAVETSQKGRWSIWRYDTEDRTRGGPDHPGTPVRMSETFLSDGSMVYRISLMCEPKTQQSTCDTVNARILSTLKIDEPPIPKK